SRTNEISQVIAASPPDRPIPVLASLAPGELAAWADSPRASARDAATRVRSQRVTPTGTKLFTISAEGSYDLPKAARRAYDNAVRRIERTNPGCKLPWGLLAGIGRVESDHGRYGGSQLGVDGVSRPLIIGIALNGVGPVAAIRDSDNGRLDGDKVWDRAVGPMQFIPTTWAVSGVDGDGDGVADPNDLDDAALAAAGYLCSNGALTDDAAMRRAVFTYNHSDYYVDLVMAFAAGYHTGVFDIPAPPVEPEPDVVTVAQASKSPKSPKSPKAPKAPKAPQSPKAPNSPGSSKDPKGPKNPSGPANPGPVKTPAPTPSPSPSPSPAPEPELELKSGTGAWTACGDGWCLSGFALDLGPTTQLARAAASDLDGDGTIEINRAELDGLVGSTVTIQVERGTAVVYTIQGNGYRNADGSFAT
ncbi:lytic murein transglycosylase, partial [Nocardioides sp.]|uniref:lytic murein transglycosylase n=1 Tax=Nocardioides sp. TaxID=35761 RepID=UPI002B277085